MPDIPAIDGLTDASDARVLLMQGERMVHAPALAIGLQPLDATLTAMAALNSTAGLVVETAADTFTKRTITVSAPLSISNGDGVAGNPAISLTSAITLGTAQASTSGTSIDFTGLPTGLNRITVGFGAVSTSGTSVPMVQIGDSGGIETAGYTGTAGNLSTAPAFTTAANSNGWQLAGAWTATATLNGFVTIQRYNSTIWMISGIISRADVSTSMLLCSGFKTLSNTLDRLRITTAGGADTFDAGEINISYE